MTAIQGLEEAWKLCRLATAVFVPVALVSHIAQILLDAALVPRSTQYFGVSIPRLLSTSDKKERENQ